jgi:hypothetical protein
MSIKYEISADENTVVIDGEVLKFFPVNKIKKTHCKYCWLLRVECFRCYDLIPCGMYRNRFDKKIGVFSIREMPEINN